MCPNPLSRRLRTHSVILDRRVEDRQVTEGEALVVPSDFGMPPVEGKLLDANDQGFRIKYDNPSPLFSGQEVHFLLPESAGLARVIWTRVVDGRMESGFLVVKLFPWAR